MCAETWLQATPTDVGALRIGTPRRFERLLREAGSLDASGNLIDPQFGGLWFQWDFGVFVCEEIRVIILVPGPSPGKSGVILVHDSATNKWGLPGRSPLRTRASSRYALLDDALHAAQETLGVFLQGLAPPFGVPFQRPADPEDNLRGMVAVMSLRHAEAPLQRLPQYVPSELLDTLPAEDQHVTWLAAQEGRPLAVYQGFFRVPFVLPDASLDGAAARPLAVAHIDQGVVVDLGYLVDPRRRPTDQPAMGSVTTHPIALPGDSALNCARGRKPIPRYDSPDVCRLPSTRRRASMPALPLPLRVP